MPHTRPIVLLVDDAPNLRESLGTVLELEGYAVDTAADGSVALQALEAGLRPAIILTDLAMPVMDGFEFRRRQLANPLLAGIPLIAYSGAFDVGRKWQQWVQRPSFRSPSSSINCSSCCVSTA